MPLATCPFCFRMIDSSRLAYQCTGRGDAPCIVHADDARVRLTRSQAATGTTFMARQDRSQPVRCPTCAGPTKRRACPQCHTALPIDFAESQGHMVSLVGSRGGGKTVLMTVLVRFLREVIGRRYDADIRIATDNPNGHKSVYDYYANREVPLYSQRTLPAGTVPLFSQGWITPVVLRWRQQTPGRFGASFKSTMLSLIDSSGEDMNSIEAFFTLQHLSVCDSIIVTIDPFSLPRVRAGLNLPRAAIHADDDAPYNVLSRTTELLRTEHRIKNKKKITIPVAIVFTKIDALFPTLQPKSPIMALPPGLPAYDDMDGQVIHEHMQALMHEWDAQPIDYLLRMNYTDYRYFAVSALGNQPDYRTCQVAPGGVHPHRVEDPVLWLLSKAGTVPLARRQ